jgi:DNA-binding NarL/FixJ family response regulator
VTAAPAAPTQLGVLLVDDQLPFRRAARSLLEAEDGYHVLGEARNGEEAVTLARQLRPELILMDVRLPGINGIEATRQILAHDPNVVVVLLSTHSQADLPADLLHCGAAGFLRKEALDPTALDQLTHET